MIVVMRKLRTGWSHVAGRAVAGNVCWLVMGLLISGLTLASTPAQSQDARREPGLQGDGIGIYVNGQLACWLGLDAGRRRGSVSFHLTSDGRSCSIGSLPRRTPRSQVAFRVSPRTAKCFVFDGRQYCE